MWISLIILLAIRILIRTFCFSFLNLLILLAYLLALICVIGKVRCGLWWVWGTSIGAILVFFIFKEGLIYLVVFDFILLILGIIAIYIEKDFTSQLLKKNLFLKHTKIY